MILATVITNLVISLMIREANVTLNSDLEFCISSVNTQYIHSVTLHKLDSMYIRDNECLMCHKPIEVKPIDYLGVKPCSMCFRDDELRKHKYHPACDPVDIHQHKRLDSCWKTVREGGVSTMTTATTTATLFDVALVPLFMALAEVESDNGQTSKNVYQLTQKYIDDVNRISKDEAFLWEDRLNMEKSERMMCIYWTYYGKRYLDQTGRTPTWETLARIHNGGPDGWKKYGTKKYWRRVKKHLPPQEEEE